MAKYLLALAVTICGIGCKSAGGTSATFDDSTNTGPTAGASRIADTPNAPLESSELAAVLFRALKAQATNPAVNADDTPEILSLRGDESNSIHCFPTATKVSCNFGTRFWPNLAVDLGARVLTALRGDDTSPLTEAVTIGVDGPGGRLTCAPEAAVKCRIQGLGARYEFDWERPEIPDERRPKTPALVEDGAKDTDGTPLPAHSNDFLTELPDGAVALRTYVATASEVSAYWNALPADVRAEFDQEWESDYKNSTKLKNCKKEEAYALRHYAGADFKELNATLRAIRGGKVDGQTISPALETRIRVTASGVRCAKAKRSRVTYRGADLSADKLARYQVGKTIVERAFTSTSPEGVPDVFHGNTEFHIWDAEGVLLGSLNPQREEDELLINAGTLFRVTYRDDGQEVPDLTVIEMQQVR